jgi:23S rRNA pseudouridine2605 synthase
MERLQKLLAHAGIASRRQCEELILEGKVKVNGQVVTELGTKVKPGKDKIEVSGKVIEAKEENVYILLYKPKGVVTTMKDPQKRKTIIDLLEGIKERVYPIGRLDYETEGLLLLTNDGELTYALTHPKHEIEKTYEAKVQGFPTDAKIRHLSRGVELEDGITAPAKVKLVNRGKSSSVVEMKIHEGKNRQVRRMFEAVGNPVLELKRTKFAFLTLGGLKEGTFRHLKSHEVQELKKLVKGQITSKASKENKMINKGVPKAGNKRVQKILKQR